MLSFLYLLALKIYLLGIKLAAIKHPKAKKWISGRKSIFKNLKNTTFTNPIWFHCASLGEYLQAEPLIKKIKEESIATQVIVSFFSPSGYENVPLTHIDYKFYLPLDSPKNSSLLISIIKPQKVIFIKYEFWYFLLNNLYKKNISSYLVCCSIHPKHKLLKFPCFIPFKAVLKLFSQIHVQDKFTFNAIKSLVKNPSVFLSGDTRIDKVVENRTLASPLPIIQEFKSNQTLVIVGSSWQKEESLVIDYINTHIASKTKFIIAPHSVSKSRIKSITKNLMLPFSLYSNPSKNLTREKILIIDCIGILSSCYKYSDIAFIGGGFSGRLHNILEPATFGNVIFFGNQYHKFFEAKKLLTFSAAYSIKNYTDFKKNLNTILASKKELKQMQENALNYINENTGATSRIIQEIL